MLRLPSALPTAFLAAALLAVSAPAETGAAHPTPDATAAPESPPPDPADVASVDAIIAAVYDVISGPAGEVRDWERWGYLFIPEARLIAVGRNAEGRIVRRVMSPDEYRQRSGPILEENGFFESEIGRVTERFGEIVHAFSTYESRRSEADEPFARGINSFQLMHDGERWWVVSIFWTSERDDLPIPVKYLTVG